MKSKRVNADAQLQYGQKALDLQKQIYDQSRADNAPFLAGGQSGLTELLRQLGLGGDSNSQGYGFLNQKYTGQDIYNDPSYKFRFAEGRKAAERALAAQGTYLAPSGVQALQDYGQGMASQEYQNAYNRFNNDQNSIYSRLAGLSGIGQDASQFSGQLGANYGQQAGDTYIGMGNAITAANLANSTRRSSMFNTLLGAGRAIGQGAMMAPSDPRLKKNIKLEGIENGHNVYSFEYITDTDSNRFIGVMADEVQKTNPDAVVDIDGYLAVNYDKIGVVFREVENAN